MQATARNVILALLVTTALPAAANESARQNGESGSGYLYFRDMGSSSTLNPQGPGSFTPSLLEAKQSARSVVAPLRSNAKAKSTERTFLFTPSGKANDRKALSVGVTSRTLSVADKPIDKAPSNIDVSGYNLGLSLGYRGFSVEAGYTKLNDTLLLNSEGVDVGVSYRGKSWKTSLQVAGERYGDATSTTPLGLDKSYSVELGGAYLLTPRLSLTGGVKYQVSMPREELRSKDGDQASGAVYVGTNIKF